MYGFGLVNEISADKKLFNKVISILDADKPGWHYLVSLEQLTDLMQPNMCVIGQVYGKNSYYHESRRLLGAVPKGFEPDNLLYYPFVENKYLPLWHELIRERLKE